MSSTFDLIIGHLCMFFVNVVFFKIYVIMYICIYFWILCSLLLICLSILVPVSYCIDYYTFVIQFKTRDHESYSFLFLKIALAVFSFFFSFNFLLCWVFVLLCLTFLQLWQAGATLQMRCTGFSLQWPLLLHSMGSRACSLWQLWHVGITAPRYAESS